MHQTALACADRDTTFLGPIGSYDFTPVFTVNRAGVVIAERPDSPGIPTVDWGALKALAGATAITTQRQLAAHLATISSEVSQTTSDVAEIVLVLLRAEPADVVGDLRNWTHTPREPAITPRAKAALAAVFDIEQWLAVGQDQVAVLARYAPRSVKNWREGMDPYPATVRRLFDLHALLGSLARAIGVEEARLWLANAGATGVSRLERLGDDEGLRSVIAEASTILFEPPTVASLHALDFEEEPHVDVAQRPDSISGPVRRIRRRS